MVEGYSIVDPIVVIVATLFTIYILATRPQRLLLSLPTLLSIYFIVPIVTVLTLWQIVPMVIGAWWALQGKIVIPARARLAIFVLGFSFICEVLFGLAMGDVGNRVLLRAMYYGGLLFLLSFSYTMVKKPGGLDLLLKGLAIAAAIHTVYGLYQIVAIKTGLPARGIVRGWDRSGVALVGGILRINGLANEPKRLGYVLALGAFALFELSRGQNDSRKNVYRALGGVVLAVSALTFSMSYLVTLGILGVTLVMFIPGFLRYAALPAALILVAGLLVPSAYDSLSKAFDAAYSERLQEVEVGLDANHVYRQELYALDYIQKHPGAILTGLGMGRSNLVLRDAYGEGAGYGDDGGVIPLNSEFLQAMFDMGGIAVIIIYLGSAFIIFRLLREKMWFLMIALLFLVYQSLTLLVLNFMVVVLGASLAALVARPESARNRIARGQDELIRIGV